MKTYFDNQTRLLLDVLGVVMKNDSVALKGGTAINFFYQDMPRLSVDIDLCYTKINSRNEFLKENEDFHQKLSKDLKEKKGVFAQIKRTSDGIAKQINIASRESEIKVETNLVLRGTVYPTVDRTSCKLIEEKFSTQMTIKTLSFEDLYSGKFCAALDRQHPRDLFDVMIFFKQNGFTKKLKRAFLVYLISGNRPIAEMIHPNLLDKRHAFKNEFDGMTDYKVTYEELEKAREQLISTIDSFLNESDKMFLLSFKEGQPLWDYIDIPHIKDLPAVKWKLHNIQNMEPKKHKIAIDELKRKLGV